MCDDDSVPTVDELDALERSLNYFSSMFIDRRKNEPAPIADNTGCGVLNEGVYFLPASPARRELHRARRHAIAGERRHDIRPNCLTSLPARTPKARVK
jgi:hypothetical protein